MDTILNDFISDIEDVEKTFLALKCIDELRGIDIPEGDSSLIRKTTEFHTLVDNARNGTIKIPGIFILYLGGRFEDYVKTIFEELAIRFANSFENYEDLPTKFKNCLVADTSMVLSSPRKYGHEEIAANNFIKNLYRNIHVGDFTKINHQCLSITSGNMRSTILKGLFSKIEITDIWKTIGEQAPLKTFFETMDSPQTIKEAKKHLDTFMDKRNRVAHPNSSTSVGGTSWPSYEEVENHIKYFKILSRAMLDVCKIKLATLNS